MTIINKFSELEQIRTELFGSDLILNSNSNSYHPIRRDCYKKYVSTIIHQLNNVSRRSKDSWVELHPNIIYVSWSPAMLKKLRRLYKNVNCHDEALILHRYGGVYSQDCIPTNNLWNLFDGCEDIYVGNKGRILASPPNSKFWKYILQTNCNIVNASQVYNGTVGVFNVMEHCEDGYSWILYAIIFIILFMLFVIIIVYQKKFIKKKPEND